MTRPLITVMNLCTVSFQAAFTSTQGRRYTTCSSSAWEPPSIFGLHPSLELNHLEIEFKCFPPFSAAPTTWLLLFSKSAAIYGLVITIFIQGFHGIFCLLDSMISQILLLYFNICTFRLSREIEQM